MKVILHVREIPIGAVVTKITGQKRYIVKDKIQIFGDPSRREIKADDNTRFLYAENGISCVSGDLEVVWELTDDQLSQFLFEKQSHQ